MKALALDGFGEQGSVRDLPVPDPAEGQFRLRIAVAGVLRSRYPDGVDAVADMHGDAEQLTKVAELVPSGGHVASVVGAADIEGLAARGVEATNVQGRVTTASLGVLASMLTRGEIVAPEIRSYSLADAGEALAAVATGHVRGKIVVTV